MKLCVILSILTLFCFFSFFPLSPSARAEGKGHGVEVRLTTPKLIETVPGKIATAGFLVASVTRQEEEFLPELKLPSDWQAVVPPAPFKLKAGERQVNIVAFLVPAASPAGGYEVTYSVRSRRDYGIADQATLSVAVSPVLRMQLLPESKPEMVIAGETYVVMARMVNRGNSRTATKLVVKGDPNYPIKVDPSEVTLEAGESRLVRMEVKTDEALNRKINHILMVKAESTDSQNKTFSLDQIFTVEIIPRVTGDADPYHRLPSQVRLIGAAGSEGEGVQVEFSGSGSLDEEGKKRIGFLFRGPDLQKKSVFAERDEYRLSLGYSFFDLHLGDRTYSLSPLTERYRYGRGAEVDIHPDKFGAGAFYLETRWDEPTVRELGAYLRYQPMEMLGVKGNYLRKSTDSTYSSEGFRDDLYTVQAKIRPNEKFDLDLEYGLSSTNREKRSTSQAYRIDLRGRLSGQVSYSFEKVYADSNVFGYYHDADYTSGSVTFPIYQKLRGNLSYRNVRENLDLDITPSKTIANRETSYRGGISYSFPFGTNASLDYEDLRKEDRLLPADFDFRERVVQLGLGHTVRWLTLQTYLEAGALDNKLLDVKGDRFERYSVYLNLNPTGKQSYSLYGRIGPDRYAGSLEKTKSFGVSASWNNLIKDLNVWVNYQNNSLDSEKHKRQDSVLSTITYNLPNKHSISLKSRWFRTNDSKEDETTVFLAYTIPFGIPVGKKKNMAVLRGKVYDAETPEQTPLPGVILAANGATAVTNKKGEFVFPSLKPGIYLLRIEKGSIGLNRVPSEKLPIKVEVKAGESTQLDIAVVRSSTVSGSITVVNGNNGNGNGKGNGGTLQNGKNQNHLPGPVSMNTTLVEITDGKEVLRQIANEKGRFFFDQLRPGTWTVRFHKENLPPHHYFEKEELQVELRPGEESEIVAKVLIRQRPIQMIEGGEIKVEIKAPDQTSYLIK